MSFLAKVPLGRTGLKVSRLGIGASYGVRGRDLAWAVEQGVNYLYWGSRRIDTFADGIREAIRAHGRDQVVVVVQSYARVPAAMTLSVQWALRRLKIEHADLLLLGWWNSAPGSGYLEAFARLRERGLVRHLMVSGHQRVALGRMASGSSFDAIMVRYNAAHRGAESEVFPALPAENRAGVVAYTATRWGTLLRAPGGLAAGMRVPSAADCYRFCLSHPAVDLVLCGPSNAEELRHALRALELGPLGEEELAWMCGFGDRVHAHYSEVAAPLGLLRTVRARFQPPGAGRTGE
jgi:aryl-alcohol dehydrogenase-like predicted oxidoreductase